MQSPTRPERPARQQPHAAHLLGPSARLQLRLLGAGDADFYCGLYQDAEVMHWIGVPLSTAQARQSFHAALTQGRRAADAGHSSHTAASRVDPAGKAAVAQVADARWPQGSAGLPVQSLRLVAEVADCRRAVALFGVERRDWAGQEWELGVMLPFPQRGQGYATEGIAALVARLFARGAQRLLLRGAVGNTGLQRLARRLGFTATNVTAQGGGQCWWLRIPAAQSTEGTPGALK